MAKTGTIAAAEAAALIACYCCCYFFTVVAVAAGVGVGAVVGGAAAAAFAVAVGWSFELSRFIAFPGSRYLSSFAAAALCGLSVASVTQQQYMYIYSQFVFVFSFRLGCCCGPADVVISPLLRFFSLLNGIFSSPSLSFIFIDILPV